MKIYCQQERTLCRIKLSNGIWINKSYNFCNICFTAWHTVDLKIQKGRAQILKITDKIKYGLNGFSKINKKILIFKFTKKSNKKSFKMCAVCLQKIIKGIREENVCDKQKRASS